MKKRFSDNAKEFKKNAEDIQKEYDQILENKNKNEKNLRDMFIYILMKKRKNRSHRRKIEEHMHCNLCEKTEKKSKFFSFPINPYTIEILKEKGFEGLIFYNEKNCCRKIELLFLKAITYLCSLSRSNSSLWYRHFLINKYHNKTNPYQGNYKHNSDKNILKERFYLTFLSEYVTSKPVDHDVFMNSKTIFSDHYEQYEQLDKLIESKTLFYNCSSQDYHRHKEQKLKNIDKEIHHYMFGEKVIIEPLIRETPNINETINKISNKKYTEKIKKNIKKHYQTKKRNYLTKSKYSKHNYRYSTEPKNTGIN